MKALRMKTWSNAAVTIWLLVFAVGGVRAEDQFFDSNNVKIRYTVEGKGEPVVLIHGFTQNIESGWSKISKPLSESYQVVAMDCRGHGKSDKPLDAKMYGSEMGEDVIRLLDHLHVVKAHLVGYSMGAYIAFGVMLTHPDRVLTVTLGAGGGIPEPGTVDTMKATADALEKDKSCEPLIRALWPLTLPAPTPDQIKQFNALLLFGRGSNEIQALAAVMRGGLGPCSELTRDALTEKLKACANPILGIAGSNDPVRKNLLNLQARLQELKGDKTGMTLVTVQGGNHVDTPSRPEFEKGIMDFLSAHKQ